MLDFRNRPYGLAAIRAHGKISTLAHYSSLVTHHSSLFSSLITYYQAMRNLIILTLAILLTVSISSCRKDVLPNPKGIVQIVYTSDQHYGAYRSFRGADVDARVVNLALVEQINTLPAMTFPADSGVNSGKTIGTLDYMIITGDMTNRQEIGPPQIQQATVSWYQFETDYLEGITLTNQYGHKVKFLLECGNHDVSNAIGFRKPMYPLTDKINYSTTLAGVHALFINIWPDSAQRIWMEQDLSFIADTTPVIIFTHDQPDCEAKHFTNPHGDHGLDTTYRFENLVEERFKDSDSINTVSTIEQRGLVTFLKAHPNIKAYFHGNDNRNEFYVYTGPDNDISLNVFRVDSPMKGTISGTDAADDIGDETKLSFQVIVIDGDTQTMTVRECLWNTSGTSSPLVWGVSSTVSLR